MEKTVLIVDDEEDIGLMVSHIMKKAGFNPTYLNRFLEASHLIAERSFDHYFLDLSLPDGTGFDLIPQIQETNPKAKIVIISAYDGDLETTRAEDFGISAFVKKPFTKADLMATLD